MPSSAVADDFARRSSCDDGSTISGGGDPIGTLGSRGYSSFGLMRWRSQRRIKSDTIANDTKKPGPPNNRYGNNHRSPGGPRWMHHAPTSERTKPARLTAKLV